MPKILKEEIKKAIEYIKESRDIHIYWVNYENQFPEKMNDLLPQIDIAGNRERHEAFINKYNFVIDVLERMK